MKKLNILFVVITLFLAPHLSQAIVTPQDKVVFWSLHKMNQLQITLAQQVMTGDPSERNQALAKRVMLDHRFAERQLTKIALAHGFNLDSREGDSPVTDPETQLIDADNPILKDFVAMYPLIVEESHSQAHQLLSDVLGYIELNDLKEMVERQLPILRQQAKLGAVVSNDSSESEVR